MSSRFSRIPKADIQRSSFDRTHGHKSTFNAGDLIPVYVDEALPGDTFNMNATIFARLNTPIYPILDNLYMDIHFFSCPMRLVWDNFRKFMGEQVDPGDSIDYTVPKVDVSGTVAESSLLDYMGIPIGYTGSDDISALFARAYYRIYNEWYRDQNLIASNDDGLDTADTATTLATGGSVLKRGKRHDYFTSALPWPQKGDAVSVPLGTSARISADVDSTDDAVSIFGTGYGQYRYLDIGSASTVTPGPQDTTPDFPLYADLTDATASTINQLRQAFQVQRLLERDARAGTRYSEIVNSHFGVEFVDATYRPEFLGGKSGMLTINPVAQTSSTDVTTPQGNLAAFGVGTIRNAGFVKSFTEHSIILGILSVRSELTYQQGINKMFLRDTRYDFYWPVLAHLGEQAIENQEIYWQGTTADTDVFGYQERYAEYRYKPSILSSAMKSDASSPLDAWHLAQDFSALPTLGQTFIEESPPMDRVVAVSTEDDFLADMLFSLRCARPMPVYGVPGLIDHF